VVTVRTITAPRCSDGRVRRYSLDSAARRVELALSARPGASGRNKAIGGIAREGSRAWKKCMEKKCMKTAPRRTPAFAPREHDVIAGFPFLNRQYAHLRTRRLHHADCPNSRGHRQINRSREETKRCRRPLSRLVQRTHVHTRPLQRLLALLSEDVVSGSVRGRDPAHERVAAAGACSS